MQKYKLPYHNRAVSIQTVNQCQTTQMQVYAVTDDLC